MANDNYPTDIALLELFEGWYDPCHLNENELRKVDGLGAWKDKTYVNPPYSNPLPWVKNAIKENKKGKTIVMLLKMDTSTKWFKELQEAGAMFLWVNGRLKYQTGKPAPFPSMLAILPKKEEKVNTLFIKE